MTQAPDSALALMQSIVAKDLPTRGLRARHALLLTMAKNKCYQDISSDTTVRMSYDWYQRHGSTRYKMLSSYYFGYVEQERGNSIEALLAFKKAETIADDLEDYRQLSLIEQHLSELFHQNYDNYRALEYSQEALSHAKLARPAMLKIGLVASADSEVNTIFLKLTVFMVSLVYVKTANFAVLFMMAPFSPMKYRFLDNWVFLS